MGFIELEEALATQTENSFFACFKGGGAYKLESAGMFDWIETGKNSSLVGYCVGNKVKGVLKDGKPWLVELNDLPLFVRDPNYEPPTANNVVNLFKGN